MTLQDCVETESWAAFVAHLRAGGSPNTALFLLALAEVTNFHFFVVTAAEGAQYILDVAPTAKGAGVEEFGLVRLAHWSSEHWAALEDSPDQDVYVTPRMEQAVLHSADALVRELRNLSSRQV